MHDNAFNDAHLGVRNAQRLGPHVVLLGHGAWLWWKYGQLAKMFYFDAAPVTAGAAVAVHQRRDVQVRNNTFRGIELSIGP